MLQPQIRNFCIIAHVDHGKSTLADRLLEVTGTVAGRAMREQVLDRIDRLLQRSVQVNDAIALQDDGKNIAVLWNSKRLGDVRRAYLAKVRDTDARVGRIARTELKPTLVSIRLG